MQLIKNTLCLVRIFFCVSFCHGQKDISDTGLIYQKYQHNSSALTQKENIALAYYEKNKGNDSLADAVALKLINTLNKNDLRQKQIIIFIRDFTKSLSSPGFTLMLRHRKEFNRVVNDSIFVEDYLSWLVRRNDPLLVNLGKTPAWDQLQLKLSKKYGAAIADRALSIVKVNFYAGKQDSGNEYGRAVAYFVERYFLQSNDTNALNDFAWNIFQHCDDREALQKATNWMKPIIEKGKPDHNRSDTYAMLLFRTGNKEQAIAEETKAIQLAGENKLKATEYEDKIKKMQEDDLAGLLGREPVVAQRLQKFQKKTFVSKGDQLNYRILYPVNYDKKKKYPVVLFLHGSGERGNDNEIQLVHGAGLFLDSSSRLNYPAFIIFPQCPPGEWWSSMKDEKPTKEDSLGQYRYDSDKPMSKVLSLVQKLMDSMWASQHVDSKKIYVGGLSMGGMGTYEILWRKPHFYAAAIDICGGGDPAKVSLYAKNFPIWVFHGSDDHAVPVANAHLMVKALKAAHANVKFTEYPGVDHNSWDKAFAEPALLSWLFSQSRN